MMHGAAHTNTAPLHGGVPQWHGGAWVPAPTTPLVQGSRVECSRNTWVAILPCRRRRTAATARFWRPAPSERQATPPRPNGLPRNQEADGRTVFDPLTTR